MNETGIQRINLINKGHFPFKTQDKELLQSIKNAHKEKRLIASHDINYIKKADIIIINIPLDVNSILPTTRFSSVLANDSSPVNNTRATFA